VHAEAVGDEPGGGELAGGDQAHQGGGGRGVDQARGDRDVPGPLLFQVQHGRLAVHADVRDPAARPDQLHRQFEGGGGADRLDGHVRAEPPGEVLDDGRRVLRAVVDGHVGAELPGLLESSVGQVDGDDVARAEQPRARDRGQADRPGAHDRHHVAGPHAAGQHAHLVAGGEDVGQHEDRLVAHAVGDPVGRGVGVRDADVLGLGAVDAVAEDPAAAFRALPVASLAAESAGSAPADAGDEHPVSRRQAVDVVTDLVDGAHGFVAEDPARTHLGHVAGQDVQVGAADRGRVDSNDHVAFVGDLRVGDFLPGPLAGAVVHERSHYCLLGRLAASSSLAAGTGEGQRPKVPPDGLKVRSPVSWAWLGSWVGPLLRREGAAAMADRVIEELSEDQCLNLISGGGIGRIAYTSRFGPAVLPVNYALQDGAVVFRTAAHGPLDEDLRTGITDADYKVAFEIDSIDLASQCGWSVLIQGPAHHVAGAEEEA